MKRLQPVLGQGKTRHHPGAGDAQLIPRTEVEDNVMRREIDEALRWVAAAPGTGTGHGFSPSPVFPSAFTWPRSEWNRRSQSPADTLCSASTALMARRRRVGYVQVSCCW